MTTLDIFDIWQKLMSMANTQQQGFIRPDINFTNWYNSVSNELFTSLAMDFGKSYQLSDKLAPFLVTANVIVNPQPGLPYDLLTLPNNFEYFTSARVIRQRNEQRCMLSPEYPIVDGSGQFVQFVDPYFANVAQNYAANNIIEVDVKLVDNQRWGGYMQHVTKKPTWDSPKVTEIASITGNKMLKVAPKGIQSIVLDYLRTPRKAVFSYTIDSNDNIIYDSSGSVQLEWSNTLENEFLERLMKKYAVYVREMGVYQVSEQNLKNL